MKTSRALIRREKNQSERVEMRRGKVVGLSGYDGVVDATRATPVTGQGDRRDPDCRSANYLRGTKAFRSERN